MDFRCSCQHVASRHNEVGCRHCGCPMSCTEIIAAAFENVLSHLIACGDHTTAQSFRAEVLEPFRRAAWPDQMGVPAFQDLYRYVAETS